MRLLRRHEHEDSVEDGAAPLEPDEATQEPPQPQPEQTEPEVGDPGLTDLSTRDYFAILVRGFKEANRRHLPNLAAALAYYAFLAIPSALLVTVGVFSLVATPETVSSLVDTAGKVMPAEATKLLGDSLTRMTTEQAAAKTAIGVGVLLALWAVGGAMQNVIWALNLAYGREESRGFVRRRLASWAMAFFVFLAFVLTFGLLVLGPKLDDWIGSAVGAEGLVHIVWWIAEWPLLLGGLLLAFAAVLYLGPNVEHPRWRFLTFGAIFAVVVWLAASGAFAFYVSRFDSYNKAWGSLSAVVIMLTWLWLSSLALLLGASINAEAERSRELRRGEPAERGLTAPAKE